jgi:hypothetical protein
VDLSAKRSSASDLVGRAVPCPPPLRVRNHGAHGVTRPTSACSQCCAFGAKHVSDKTSCATHLLMQAMGDQPTCAFQKLSIFLVESIQFIALGIQHAENVPMLISHRDEDL